MATITLNIEDTFSQLVSKFNELSSGVGNLTGLDIGGESDISNILTNIYSLIDSDTDFRSKISVTDAGGDGSLAYNSTTGVITYTGPSATEVRAHFSAGTNTTYASGQFSISDATIRSKISVTDAGGDGSLAYNSSTGEITYTGPSATEVRAHFSASTGITLSSGAISITAGGVDTTQLADDAVSRAKLKDEVGLVIYNSTGTALKTLYGAGS